jgi:hypothetical protein
VYSDVQEKKSGSVSGDTTRFEKTNVLDCGLSRKGSK